MSDYTKRLKQAQSMWKAAKERAAQSRGGQSEFEDGRYMARLVDGTIGESQSSGRLQITWIFRFAEGEYEGQDKLDFSGLETETNLEYLGRRLNQLGYELPESLPEIEDILADVRRTKPLCKIRLKTKGEFQNVYLDKVFASGAEETGEEPEETEDVSPPTAPEESDAEVDVEEEEPTLDEEEDSVELTVGMAVTAHTSKGALAGEVVEILNDEGKARVRLADGKVVRVPIESLEVNDEVPEEPPVPPKKTAPVPTPQRGRRK